MRSVTLQSHAEYFEETIVPFGASCFPAASLDVGVVLGHFQNAAAGPPHPFFAVHQAARKLAIQHAG